MSKATAARRMIGAGLSRTLNHVKHNERACFAGCLSFHGPDLLGPLLKGVDMHHPAK